MSAPHEEQAAITADVIHEQLERLLASPYFSHSKRFPAFLRFVADQALGGNSDQLKERTLGIEVFGRGADYDTASDPIVRVTAAEIRKRISQYYGDPGHESELRVSLPSGSYIPQFYWPHEGNPEAAEQARVNADSLPHKNHTLARRVTWLALSAVVLLSLGILAGVYVRTPQRPGFNYFWEPVLHSHDPVLFCVADQNEYADIALRDASDPTRQRVLKDNLTAVVFDDLSAVVRMAGIMQSNGKQYSLLGENATTLNDLRTGTTIVVGAFDNVWALRLTRQLRYHFDNNEDMTEFRIVDSGAKPHAAWVVNRAQQLNTNNYKDYAIVARFTDPTTGKLTVIAAGIARGGTIAAGEFLTNPNDLDQLESVARAAGNKANMEFVLSTQIIGNDPGIPKIEASYFW